MILSSFAAAVGQLPDRRFHRIVWRALGITIAALVAAIASVLWFVRRVTSGPIDLPFFGEVDWLGPLLGWGAVPVVIVLSVILMLPVASAVTSLFLDDIATAVEDRHYPTLPNAPHVGFIEGLRDSLNFLCVLIGLNVVMLLLYPFLLVLALPAHFAMNGYLLGREYFQLAAMRRVGRTGAKTLRKKYRFTIWCAGCLMVIPLAIPVFNLIVPIIGAASFTHLYHKISRR